jgi:quercetin dioxygenase-like cupin family protein
MTTDKAWGKTTLIFNDKNVEIYRAEIMKGGMSSKHFHEFKYNLFFLESGFLIVKIWEHNQDYREIFLHSGDSITIEPKKWHKFLAVEPCQLLEIYYTELKLDDIIRE